MKRSLFFLIIVAADLSISFAQPAQISISRVAQMPDLPSPYVMRNWKQVAIQYDAFVFDQQKTGEHLPLIGLKSSGTNFPELKPILLDTYVGTNSNGQAEAINIIPALVSASLMHIDKFNQGGINWVEKVMDFYNSKNGEDVYLNSYNTFSGNDWWYDLMPNVFFYQLYTQYPHINGFDEQFITIANRWLQAVQAMGGKTTPWTAPQMNYRGWHLSTMTPNTEGVKEPESAGAICWLLYHAWKKTGQQKYLKGAMLAMDFLSAQTVNPSYELQLSYGVLAAAKMNAIHEGDYDLAKMMNWCFDRGPLRGWGTIKGTWNGNDVSGLIGEANDNGNDYAFLMNGFQQAAALVPLMKYDKRFARDIARWTLNLANASRLFYPQYLPQADQDDHAWSTLYDPQSVIAYEALKENLNGKNLFGTGDAKKNGWAQTNLGIYGSSHVGYLAAVTEPTDVEGILLLDLNATDFFGENAFPSYSLYNPHASAKDVTLSLGAEVYDIYNAIAETNLLPGATGNVTVTVPPGEVMLLVYLPAGELAEAHDGKLWINDQIADHHYGYDFQAKFRIRSMDVTDTLLEFDQQSTIYSTIQNAPGIVSYNWYVDDVWQSSESNSFTWTAPGAENYYTVKLEVTSGTLSSKDSIIFHVVENIPEAPVITEIASAEKWYETGEEISLICKASNEDGGTLIYNWTLSAGTLVSQNDSLIRWKLPQQQGIYQVSCTVTNTHGLRAEVNEQLLVKTANNKVTTPLAYYPLDGDVLDYSGNEHHAMLEGAQLTDDPRGDPKKAYRFSAASDIIYVENKTILNFQREVTLSFWVKLDAVTQESFILSHGSWEDRWKISITPDNRLRWTVKTSEGVKDLDSKWPLILHQFYHVTAVYTGYTMEMYLDGELNAYAGHTGLMLITDNAITLGQKSRSDNRYYLTGTVDEVRIYDEALQPGEISVLKTLWLEETVTGIRDHEIQLRAFPNPSRDGSIWIDHPGEKITGIEMTDASGRVSAITVLPEGTRTQISSDHHSGGLFIIKVTLLDRVEYFKIVFY